MANELIDEHQRVPDPHGSATAQISIDEALENNWVDVWYQPKIDLRRKCWLALKRSRAFNIRRLA